MSIQEIPSTEDRGSVTKLTQDRYQYSFNLQGSNAAARLARLVGKNKRVLELGCGPGSQSRVLRDELGCSVVGIEIDPGRAEKARAFCTAVHEADLETQDIRELLDNEKFDVVTCADVLEHLKDPGNVLREIKSMLTDSGYVVASIPNITHASVVYEMAHGRFEYRSEGVLDATHLRFFSRASAAALFEQSGYWISDFERVRRTPESTELRTLPISDSDRILLAAIKSANPEAETRQFVIKAQPLLAGDAGLGGTPLAMQEELHRLREAIASYETETRHLRSLLRWYETPMATRLLRRLGLARTQER